MPNATDGATVAACINTTNAFDRLLDSGGFTGAEIAAFCFTDDAVFEDNFMQTTSRGRAEIAGFTDGVIAAIAGMGDKAGQPIRHHIANHAVWAADEAGAMCCHALMVAYLGVTPIIVLDIRDTLVETAQGWRISKRTYLPQAVDQETLATLM